MIAPDGTDRRGKIWGGLVPYGMSKDSFGTCGDECPWRAGANENTVFRVSHDVKVEGQPLAAGSYGLFMVAGPEEFTIIFSKNSTSWGHYFYTAKEDALRVKVKPRKAPYTHWLTFDFVERKPEEATVVLRWDELEVPIRVQVPDVTEIYLGEIRNQLRNATGFDWQSWEQAAQFCLGKKINLPEALKWAEHAATPGFTGQENFRTLSTLSQAQAANGQAEVAKATMQKALEHPTATVTDLHMYGRQLQAQKKNRRGRRRLPPQREAPPRRLAGERRPRPRLRGAGEDEGSARRGEEGPRPGARRRQPEQPEEPHHQPRGRQAGQLTTAGETGPRDRRCSPRSCQACNRVLSRQYTIARLAQRSVAPRSGMMRGPRRHS